MRRMSTVLLVHQEDSEQNEVDRMKGADSTGEVMHM